MIRQPVGSARPWASHLIRARVLLAIMESHWRNNYRAGVGLSFDDARTSQEGHTLQRMSEELIESDRQIEDLLGVRPVTFAYPCGQSQSYVPLAADRLIFGREAKYGSARSKR